MFPSSYKDYSQFETKAECENIFALTCDLTNETALDYNEHYLAKVLVNGQHYGYSTRFKPTAHSKILHPSVAVLLHLKIPSFHNVFFLSAKPTWVRLSCPHPLQARPCTSTSLCRWVQTTARLVTSSVAAETRTPKLRSFTLCKSQSQRGLHR